jgi:ABC-2 type transport system ATP-binding protein
MSVIELEHITYTPPSKQSPVLRDVDLVVNQGEFVLLQGANFIGKSTLVEIILGIREADNDDAKVRLFGYSPDKIEPKFLTGVVLQEKLELPSWIQIGKFIDLIECHYPGSKGKLISLLEASNIKFDNDFIGKRTNNEIRSPFSGGEERLFSLALALAGSPKLLILDELTSPLSKENKEKCWQFVKSFLEEQGGTVLLVSPKDDIEEELRNNGIRPTQSYTLEDGKLKSGTNISDYQISDSKEAEFLPMENLGILHWIVLASKYAGINFEKLLVQPTRPLLNFVFGILFVVVITLSFNELRDRAATVISYSDFWLLVNICSFYLAVVSTTSIGTNIALGRKEAVWTKARQTLPVPPIVYLVGEVIPYLLIWSVLALSLTIAASICLNLSFSPVLDVSLWLVIGMLPFLFLGLAIGYGLPLDSVDLIALGLPLVFEMPLVVGAFIRLVKIAVDEMPQSLVRLAILADNISAHSPLYHWVQLTLASVQAREYDQYFKVHLAWLIWTTAICALLAVKAYRRSYKFSITSTARKQEG